MFLSRTDLDRCAWGCATLLSPNPWSFSVDKGNDWKQARRHRGTREWKWSSSQRPGKTERCAAGLPGKCFHRLSTRTRRTLSLILDNLGTQTTKVSLSLSLSLALSFWKIPTSTVCWVENSVTNFQKIGTFLFANYLAWNVLIARRVF